jgi:hypothetical protein
MNISITNYLAFGPSFSYALSTQPVGPVGLGYANEQGFALNTK